MDKNLLQSLEIKYGGLVRAKMRKKSPYDTNYIIGKSRIKGGNRMAIHGYDKIYAQCLPSDPRVIVELGVLRGTGLAIWCDVYPGARVIGLDIDTSLFDKQMLESRGAFQLNEPELYEFDKFIDGADFYQHIPSIDVWIDDSAHDTSGILHAFNNVRSFLSARFVCFIEDNHEVFGPLKEQHPDLDIQLFRCFKSWPIVVIKPK